MSVVSSVVAGGDPASILNAQLASALSTMGDAQYWEENISPNTIRSSLASSDPSNPNSTPALLKGMKWLLASISKGRDVSDFYPHVVKLVGATSLEVRKMVYMYLVQYADRDATTRELSLLSINSFQRGLADSEQLIRALALRVLTSIRIPDILQIQILGVQKCAKDNSPYVRKCAANALAKLSPRCCHRHPPPNRTDADEQQHQREMLLEIMKALLDRDSSTMVLTSSVIAFCELCPDRLEYLHGSFRKICHLLTDMDEWGQVVVIDTLTRYCRRFFREPRAWREGTAEKIDRERRVRRTLSGIVTETTMTTNTPNNDDNKSKSGAGGEGSSSAAAADGGGKRSIIITPQKVKRRVQKKGFYSDEEDDSTDEEVYEDPSSRGQSSSTLAGVMRQRHIMGVPDPVGAGAANNNENDFEDDELNEDHRLLLRSAMPLLKSRNAGVVLAVCSLQYYCGVSSVKVRSAIGKALVRIHRDRREIQYIVLSSIRTLVHECPSAFAPFRQEFFVMAMDPSFTRLIKLDILVALALDPVSIEDVLNELRTYIRHGDKTFACASIRAVGTIVELARIVHDRHGAKPGCDGAKERRRANRTALNCLHGLSVLSRASDDSAVVGECVTVMQRILLQLSSSGSAGGGDGGKKSDGGGGVVVVQDPNNVQDKALSRVLLLLVNSLNVRASNKQDGGGGEGESDDDDDDDNDDDESAKRGLDLKKVAGVVLPSAALASALWIIGEWAAPLKGYGGVGGLSDDAASLRIRSVDEQSFFTIRLQICRLLAKAFVFLDPSEKEQAIHFATKVLVSRRSSSIDGGGSAAAAAGPQNDDEVALCESILAMGRLESNPDVRDRARHESNLIHLAIGLQYDKDGMEPLPPTTGSTSSMVPKPTIDNLKRMFLQSRPASSSLPLEDVHYKNRAAMGESGGTFRFGTLSSLVGHRARTVYLPLPPWAAEDSPSSLRDPVKRETQLGAAGSNVKHNTSKKANGGSPFYDNADSDDESSSSSSSSDSGSGSSSDSSSSSDNSGDDASYDGDAGSTSSGDDDGDDENVLLPTMPNQPFVPQSSQIPYPTNGGAIHPELAKHTQPMISSDDSSESSSDSGSDTSSSDDHDNVPNHMMGGVGNLIPMGGPPLQQQPMTTSVSSTKTTNGSAASSSAADDLKGLVLEPVVVDANDNGEPSIEKESSSWVQLVRASSVGGLSVKARYIHGKTKIREVQLMGLTAEKPSTVCLQIRFDNQRTDGGVVRRLRILQRASSSSSSHIGPKKVVVPAEIAALKQGQMSNVMLGIDFASPSDRDDSLLARFDIKFSGGSIPVEIRPSLVQLLLPCERNREAFDSGMAKLQGFNRVESTFQVADASFLTKEWIRKHANLTPVAGVNKQSAGMKDGLRFVGSLPASGDPVFVLTSCSSDGAGRITVCCEQALAVNGILNHLKKAIAEASATS